MNPMLDQIKQLAAQTGVQPDEVFEALEHSIHSVWTRQHEMQGMTRGVKIDRQSGAVTVEFIDDSVQSIDLTDDEHGRVAARAVKEVLSGFVRRAKSSEQLEQWADYEGRILRGRVIDSDKKRTLVDVQGASGIIPASKRVQGDFHRIGDQVAFMVTKIDVSRRGEVELVGTRRGPEFVEALIADIVPEIASGDVEVAAAARVDGEETLVLVRSNTHDVSAAWAVRGPDNVRSRSIQGDMPRRERLQVVADSDDLNELVRRGLRPANVKAVSHDDETVTIIGVDDKMDLERLKRRLKLLGQILDRDMIVEAGSAEGGKRTRDGGSAGADAAIDPTRCKKMIRDGARQCPNTPLEGSDYCGLHQGEAS